jgi:hypothetical protein
MFHSKARCKNQLSYVKVVYIHPQKRKTISTGDHPYQHWEVFLVGMV